MSDRWPRSAHRLAHRPVPGGPLARALGAGGGADARLRRQELVADPLDRRPARLPPDARSGRAAPTSSATGTRRRSSRPGRRSSTSTTCRSCRPGTRSSSAERPSSPLSRAPAAPSSARRRRAAPSSARPARAGPTRRSPGRCCGSGRRAGGPASRLTPGITRGQRLATCSKVLWSSLRTITRQLPPRPRPGPALRGFSIVWSSAHCASSARGAARTGSGP